MSILSIIASHNYITVNKLLIKELGLTEAILLGELAGEYEYWNNRDELKDGYFYSTIQNVKDATNLTAHEQRKALNHLQELGILELQRKEMPSKRYIKINEDAVVKIFNNKLLKKLTTSCKKNEQQVVKKVNTNKNKEIKINNKNKYTYMGKYENAFFTDEQLTKLKEEFSNWEEWVDKLDSYMQSTGKKYKDCLATIRNWARKEKENTKKRENQRTYANTNEYYDNIKPKKRITGNDRDFDDLNKYYDN